MAGSVNKVILVGSLGADPEVKSFANGGRIANLRMATNESWREKQTGERKERVDWHSVVISGDGLVGVAERYLRKGSKVYIEGQLRTRKYQAQDGSDRYTTEIVIAGIGGKLVMLDSAQGGDRGGGREVYNSDRGGWQDKGSGWGSSDNSGGGWGDDDLDDQIPF